MSTTIYGLDDVSLTSRTTAHSQDGSESVTEVWKGPVAKAQIKYDALILTYGVDDVTLSIDRGMGTITIKNATDVPAGGTGGASPADAWTWECVGGDLEKPLESHTAVNKDDYAVGIGLILSQHAQGQLNYGYTGAGTICTLASPYNTFATLHRRGTVSFLRSMVTVRASKRVSKRSVTLHTSWSGVDRAWKISEADGPSLMPADLKSSLALMPGYNSAKKQWLKRAPQQRTSDGRYYDVSMTWIWAERWSEALYFGDNESDGSNP